MARLQRQLKLTDYEGFVEKFKAKKTTDDCYTPSEVFDAVVNWVMTNIPEAKGREIVRPFYPGGDYETYDYPDNCIVLDNPPFSILSRIVSDYARSGSRFFLFAPHLTLFRYLQKGFKLTAIVTGTKIIYENGAAVNTSFITNCWPTNAAVVVSGDLKQAIKGAQKKIKAEPPKITFWPENMTAAALLDKAIIPNENWEIPWNECAPIGRLDCGRTIFGAGLLISDRVAAELRAAEQKVAELRAAELRAVEQIKLSERERLIIEALNKKD